MQMSFLEDVGDVVCFCVYRAKRDWRDDHAKGVALSRLFEERIRAVEATVTEKRYGQAEVLVRIVADRPWNEESYFYKFSKDANRWREDLRRNS